MNTTLDSETLRELLLTGNRHATNSILDDAHPRDIADAGADLDDPTLWSLLEQLDPPLNADVFSHLPIERQAVLAERFDPARVADLLESMASDDRADLIQQLAEPARDLILQQMEVPQRRDTERLAEYAEGTAGSVMSSDVTTLLSDQTVMQAMQHLRAMAGKKETIYYNYVIDIDGRLLGIVSLRDLVLANPDVLLADVMNRDVIRVDVADSVDEVGRKIREYDLLALPVVDDRGRLVGIVTVDDVLDAAEAETTEDFNKLGATGLGRASYRDASVLLLYRRRIVWLLVLVFVNIFSGAGIAVFENTIAVVPALVIFLPLLIGSGGNAGSQSATLMVRALATGEADIRDWLRLLLKEIAVALGLGLTMAVGVGLVSSVMAPQVLWAVVPSMVLLVMVGSLIGLLLPFVLTKLNMDPATASGPLITSLADISGVLIYFAVASYMLRDVLAAATAAA